jgi:proteic killer suppression protein
MKIILSKIAKKQLDLIPDHIYRKYLYWIDLIQSIGLLESRKYKGFHDEPLHGDRKGQRSVRLSKGYRAIYEQTGPKNYEIIEIIEVNKHDY